MGRIDIGTKELPACRIDSSGWLYVIGLCLAQVKGLGRMIATGLGWH